MTFRPAQTHSDLARCAALLAACSLLVSSACSTSSPPTRPQPAAISTEIPAALNATLAAPPSPDPRVGLRGGWFDAAEASWNMSLLSTTRPDQRFQNPANPTESRLKSSDLAFTRNIVYQGNYSGWQAWDISNPARPRLVHAYWCPGTQSDVSVFRNLLFVSHEATATRIDCGEQGVPDTVSADRARGVRVYDISNVANPRRLAMVQTCRGSHTHTLLTDPRDTENVYIYVSGSSAVRSPNELAGCTTGTLAANPQTAEFRIEVIQVPLANPAAAAIVTSPRIFNNLTAAPGRSQGEAPAAAAGGAAAGRAGAAPAAGGAAAGRGGAAGGGGGGGGRGGAAGATTPRPGPTQCHDITVYPEIGRAGGACGGYGIILDIRDPKNPRRLVAAADTNMSAWHSVTFNNDGTKVLFSDEWGGGTNPRCRVGDPMMWGADAIFEIDAQNRMTQRAYFKMPAVQTEFENCVAHNGSLVPIPGRDVMVQSWYQGGISVFDWTDPNNPKEIAFFDRGPLDPTKLTAAGHWSAYWYNGYIYASEEFRGLDVLELHPSPFLSQNEIDAAKSVRFQEYNPQNQQRFVWPASFAVARSYLDQLARGAAMDRERLTAISTELARIERLRNGQQRRTALTALATTLAEDERRSADVNKSRMLTAVIREMAEGR
jgi:hypothetical protein